MAIEGLQGQYRLLELVAEDAFSQTFRGEDLRQSEPQPCWIQRVEGGAVSPAASYSSTLATLKDLPPDWAIQPLAAVCVENEAVYWIYTGAPGHYLSQTFDAEEKLTEDQAVQLLKNILPTLGSLHERGIIHGNLQPQSFFYDHSQEKWGLSHFGALYQGLPQIAQGQGANHNSAPIALSGYLPPDTTVPHTVEGDLYSLGVTIIHGVTGISPADLTPQWRNTAPVSERLANLLNLLITQYFSSAPELFEWLTMAAKNSQTQESQRKQSQVTKPASTGMVNPEDLELAANVQQKTPVYLAHRYRVLRPLSRGGFGETYLAIDEQFPGQPTCIIKKLKLKNYTQKTYEIAKHLFQREAEVLGRLGQHDQIPQLLAHFTQNQEFYLVQEYIEGHDLEAELPLGKKWPEFEVRQLLQELLEVLAVIHREGVIHRDLKPANIRRRDQDGKLVLIDFGAVKQASKHTSLDGKTKVTVSIGTVGYAPSEQTQGRPKLSSDVYAVGMIALQALTGKDPEHIPEDVKTGELQWRQLVEVTPNFAQFLDRMVRYDFRQRFESAMQALSALQTLDRRVSGPQDAKPIKPVPSRRPWRQWGLRAVGGLAVLSLATWGARTLLQPSLKKLSGNLQQSLVVVNPGQAEPTLGFVVEGAPEYCTVLTTRAAIAQGEAVNLEFHQTPPQMVDQVQTLPHSDLVILQRLHNLARCPHPSLPLGKPDRLETADKVYIQTTTAATLTSQLTAPLTAIPLTEIETSSLPGVFRLGYQPPATLLAGSAVVNRQGGLLALHIGEAEEANTAWAIPITLYQEHLAVLEDLQGKSVLERADQLFELQQHDAALVAYDQAITQQSERPEPWYGRGSTLYALERYGEAIAAYEQALALRKDNTLTWYSKGNALFQLQRYEEAIAAYEGAIDTKSDYFPAINNLGLAQQALGRTTEAIATFERVIALRPDYHPAHNNLGATRQMEQDYAGAIAAYDQAIRIRSNYAAAWYNKASAHALQNQTAPALKALNRAIALRANLAQSARENTDFASLRNHGEFQKLVNPPKP